MDNPESVQEDEAYEILWDVENHLISARWQDLMMIKHILRERTCQLVDFAVPVDHWVKMKENEKRDKYLVLEAEVKSYGTWK